MLYNTFHNRWLRLIAAVAGEFIAALGINLFIVPLGLYSGGTLGVCQLIRTLMQTYLHLDFGGYDIAGILYFLSNIPILIFAYKVLGRGLAMRTIVCTVSYSVFYSLIPIPVQPIVDDYLTACLLGDGLWLRYCVDLRVQQRWTGRGGALPEQAGQHLYCWTLLIDLQRLFVCGLSDPLPSGDGHLLCHL